MKTAWINRVHTWFERDTDHTGKMIREIEEQMLDLSRDLHACQLIQAKLLASSRNGVWDDEQMQLQFKYLGSVCRVIESRQRQLERKMEFVLKVRNTMQERTVDPSAGQA